MHPDAPQVHRLQPVRVVLREGGGVGEQPRRLLCEAVRCAVLARRRQGHRWQWSSGWLHVNRSERASPGQEVPTRGGAKANVACRQGGPNGGPGDMLNARTSKRVKPTAQCGGSSRGRSAASHCLAASREPHSPNLIMAKLYGLRFLIPISYNRTSWWICEGKSGLCPHKIFCQT